MLKKSPDATVWLRQGRVAKPWRLPIPASTAELGQWGEWIALKHVRKMGWDVMARNWKGGHGEVDLIAYDGPSLVFAEVKTRRLPGGPPEDNVGVEKERRLDRLADEFILRYEVFGTPVRVDIIAVETSDGRDFKLRHHFG